MQQRCQLCHNAAVANKNVRLDSAEEIVAHAQQIYQQAVVLKLMPMNNATQITDAERAALGRWYEAGAGALGRRILSGCAESAIPNHPRRPHMSLRINDTAPDFEADTTQGQIRFHDWIGDKWAILFSHPKDFTPVCTTELGYMAKIEPEFTKRNAKLIGLSADPVDRHSAWSKDIEETQGAAVKYPMIADHDLKVAKLYNMLPADEVAADGRTAVNNATVRSVFIIGPDKKVKLMLTYPMSVGRNFDEILRVLDALQLTAKHAVATPVNWKHGDDVIIPTSVSDDDAKKKYPAGFKTHKPYLRTVKQPT